MSELRDGRTAELEAYLGSWAGCDGGNPRGVWICGIEYGGELRKIESELDRFKTRGRYQSPGSWDAEFKANHPKLTTWSYHQRVAKLMLALRALRAGQTPSASIIGDFRDYMQHELYVADGETFKLNLFPLSSPAVRSAQWQDVHRAHPALSSKSAYYALCVRKRFEFLARQRRHYRPGLILGTGITFRKEFARAFGFDEASEEFDLEAGGAKRRCHLYRSTGASLLVTPFFGGRYGIVSHKLLAELARQMLGRELLP